MKISTRLSVIDVYNRAFLNERTHCIIINGIYRLYTVVNKIDNLINNNIDHVCSALGSYVKKPCDQIWRPFTYSLFGIFRILLQINLFKIWQDCTQKVIWNGHFWFGTTPTASKASPHPPQPHYWALLGCLNAINICVSLIYF